MKSKYSCGMDGIPTSALKNSPDNILTALSHVVNLSLSQGMFFQALKLQKQYRYSKKAVQLMLTISAQLVCDLLCLRF